MAFCKYCGTQIQDGEVCNCDKAVAARTVVENPAPAAQQAAPTAQQAAPAGTNIDYNDGVAVFLEKLI